MCYDNITVNLVKCKRPTAHGFDSCFNLVHTGFGKYTVKFPAGKPEPRLEPERKEKHIWVETRRIEQVQLVTGLKTEVHLIFSVLIHS